MLTQWPRNILTFNCGSSSLTFKIFKVKAENDIEEIFIGKAHRVGVKGSEPSFIEYKFSGKTEKVEAPLPNHGKAAWRVLKQIEDLNIKIDYIGHRWTLSAGHFTTAFINDKLIATLKTLVPLFPIHHPAMLAVIARCVKSYPDILQYVTSDNAYHSTLPEYAHTYALPRWIIKKYGFRKYGFHGLSYNFVVNQAGQYLKRPASELKIVACHLGTGGSSVAAVDRGKSIDTSMGYTGLPGLVMSTRTGDIDPMLTIYMMIAFGLRSDEITNLLNTKSGLLGLSGFSSDIRDIIKRIPAREKQAEIAFNMYVHRLRKYIGSYVALLGGADALLFTDDIGLHNVRVREKACQDMDWCGIRLDPDRNRQATGENISVISSPDSKVTILSMPTEEERVICWDGIRLMKETDNAAD
ncbi:MAG: acetate/propionate family kinase [Fibrobacterota bacterium]